LMGYCLVSPSPLFFYFLLLFLFCSDFIWIVDLFGNDLNFLIYFAGSNSITLLEYRILNMVFTCAFYFELIARIIIRVLIGMNLNIIFLRAWLRILLGMIQVHLHFGFPLFSKILILINGLENILRTISRSLLVLDSLNLISQICFWSSYFEDDLRLRPKYT
jgi:hypothetical protein